MVKRYLTTTKSSGKRGDYKDKRNLKRRAPTIKDVAAHAGVSPMTVSRVVNGEGYVRQETREVVEAAITTLKYSPNWAARSLAAAEPVRVGMLHSDLSAAFLSELLVGS